MLKPKLNPMKHFDPIAASQGAEVCTRAGKMARILSMNEPCRFYGVNYPIVAIFEDMGGNVSVGCFTEQGRYQFHTESDIDLMMRHDDYLERLNVDGKHPVTPLQQSGADIVNEMAARLSGPIEDFCVALGRVVESYRQITVVCDDLKKNEEERSREQRDERAKASEHIR